jgi:hypothetical protein
MNFGETVRKKKRLKHSFTIWTTTGTVFQYPLQMPCPTLHQHRTYVQVNGKITTSVETPFYSR